MKTIQTVTIMLGLTLVLTGCQKVDTPAPTQNKALDSVSSSSAEKKGGALQEGLDYFLKEYDAMVHSDPKKEDKSDLTSTDITSKKNETFLQFLADKLSESINEDSNSTSHVEEMQTLPAIGSSSKRR